MVVCFTIPIILSKIYSLCIKLLIVPRSYWAADMADQNQWIQVEFYSKTEVTGAIVQGRPDADEWITRYKVSYSLDGPTWGFILDDNNTVEVR